MSIHNIRFRPAQLRPLRPLLRLSLPGRSRRRSSTNSFHQCDVVLTCRRGRPSAWMLRQSLRSIAVKNPASQRQAIRSSGVLCNAAMAPHKFDSSRRCCQQSNGSGEAARVVATFTKIRVRTTKSRCHPLPMRGYMAGRCFFGASQRCARGGRFALSMPRMGRSIAKRSLVGRSQGGRAAVSAGLSRWLRCDGPPGVLRAVTSNLLRFLQAVEECDSLIGRGWQDKANWRSRTCRPSAVEKPLSAHWFLEPPWLAVNDIPWKPDGAIRV